MSLLLNALKKAEEGGENTDKQEEVVATPSPAGQVGDSPATPNLSKPVLQSAAPGVSIATPPPAKPDIIDDIEPKKRVDAARVLGAQQTSSGGGGGLVKGGIILAVLGGGGYFSYSLGLHASVVDLYDSYFGSADTSPQIVQVAEPARDLKVTEDLVLLPIPSVDVQSGIDFSALQLPENQKDNLGDRAYAEKIAVLTGYNLGADSEQRRQDEEARVLLSVVEATDSFQEIEQEQIGQEFADEGVGLDDFNEFTEVEEVIYTAELSRDKKSEIDAQVAYEDIIQLKVLSDEAENAEQAENSGEGGEVVPRSEKKSDSSDGLVAQISVGVSPKGVNRKKDIDRAIKFYYAGEYVKAELAYRNVLSESPRDINALRGLAQLAVATGRYQSAVSTYLEILKFYPNDPIAVAELTNLRVSSKDQFNEIESLLRKSLGKAGEADSRIHFAMGNLYAESGYWKKAQQSYFEAVSIDKNNPDYAYNLAVVLDYLNKPALAVQYYQLALNSAEGRLVGFNRAEVVARISDLQN